MCHLGKAEIKESPSALSSPTTACHGFATCSAFPGHGSQCQEFSLGPQSCTKIEIWDKSLKTNLAKLSLANVRIHIFFPWIMAGCCDGSMEPCERLWRMETKGKFSKCSPMPCISVKLLVPLFLIFSLSGATRKT